MEPTPDHELIGRDPNGDVKSLRVTEDGEFDKEIKSKNNQSEHTEKTCVKCKCGERWKGTEAEEQAKNHLLRKTAVTRIRWKHNGAEYADWELRYDEEASTLYWALEQPSKMPLQFHATPFYEEGDGITIHIDSEEDEVVTRLAEDRSPEEIIEDYVEIVTQYIYRTWIVP